MSGNEAALVLFRRDLRTSDNRALAAAAATGRPVIPAFILENGDRAPRQAGGAGRWWLHLSLTELGNNLARLGSPLVLRTGDPEETTERLIAETGATAVFWNRRYDPKGSAVDRALKARLKERGLTAESFDGALLHEPSQLKTGSGGHYRVYSPFWRALEQQPEPRDPVAAPKALRGPPSPVASDDLDDWHLLPTSPDWAGGLRERWAPGEKGATERLESFLDGPLDGYGAGRDFPGSGGTSLLSPHLAHGEITPFQILSALARRSDAPQGDRTTFRKELVWREFSWHLLFHNPDLATKNFNLDFDAFPWRDEPKLLRAWCRGQTGYPIVDAGMRELWQTGWMHNRVRMVVASFLVKHLLIDWRAGERWFWDTLVDADPANNPASWQWVAGSGADAAPYFRIFNPVLQGEKFDADGTYVRRYVPEIARLADKWLHRPWEASATELSRAGVKLGRDYPVPVVDHALARDRAMEAYKSTRGQE